MRKSRRRLWRASIRDTYILIREFRPAVAIFACSILGGGFLYFVIAENTGEPVKNFYEALYIVLTLAFLQPTGNFPDSPALEAFYFIMPLVGIGTLALGLADFGYLLFNRRARSKEWEMALASTLDKHHILVGLGHLGYHVAENLKGAMNQPVAIIELDPKTEEISKIQDMDIPIIQDDASKESALEAAGVARAASIILCIQDDALNLKIAVKARSLNPNIRVIIRIFDDVFAQAINEQFGFTALSGTGLAAPSFAASAIQSDITRPISIEGETLSLARITVNNESLLEGATVGSIEDNYDVSIILVRHNQMSEFHPTDKHQIFANDLMAVLGTPDRLHKVIHDSQ